LNRLFKTLYTNVVYCYGCCCCCCCCFYDEIKLKHYFIMFYLFCYLLVFDGLYHDVKELTPLSCSLFGFYFQMDFAVYRYYSWRTAWSWQRLSETNMPKLLRTTRRDYWNSRKTARHWLRSILHWKAATCQYHRHMSER